MPMEEFELLQYAVENGMIDMSYVQEQIEMNKRKELLEKHPHKYGREQMDTGVHICLTGGEGKDSKKRV